MRLSSTWTMVSWMWFAFNLLRDVESTIESVEGAENEKHRIPRELWAVQPPHMGGDINTILGGVPTVGQEFPFYVQPDSSVSGYVCGGSLVAKDMVLSAAHCVVAWNSVRVLVGPYQRDSTLGPAQWRNIKSNFTIHPEYNDANLNYDYVMFKIEAVTMTNLKPIKLNKSKTNPVVNQPLTTIGMGVDNSGDISNLLKKVTISTVSYPVCRAAWAPYDLLIKDEIVVCATTTDCKTAWRGDSGGPLFDNKENLVGIVSFGINNLFDDCKNNIPNGYARVSGAIDWIEEQICAYSDYVPKDIKCRKNPKGAKGTKGVKGVKTPKRVRQRLGR